MSNGKCGTLKTFACIIPQQILTRNKVIKQWSKFCDYVRICSFFWLVHSIIKDFMQGDKGISFTYIAQILRMKAVALVISLKKVLLKISYTCQFLI